METSVEKIKAISKVTDRFCEKHPVAGEQLGK
jgi:hypothetical protein